MVDIRSTMGESVGMATGEGIRLSRCRHCHDGSGHRRVEHWPMHHAGEQTLRGRPMAWRNFVAMGDSFTEGMNDAYPDGTYRGWADLVAARPAVDSGPDFGYANRQRFAERHGAYLIDLFADDAFRHPHLWSADRLPLPAAGPRRVAGHVLNVLGVGVGVDEQWMLVPPMPEPT